MLEINDLNVSVGEHSFLWSFAVGRGSFTAVVGPSGVGKSTLFKSLLGANVSAEGEIRWLGQKINSLEVHRRPFGVLFQTNNLFDHLSVRKNLQLGLNANGKLNKNQEVKLLQAAERFELTNHLNKSATDLSGGQYQRVALARVFLQNKPVLLLDEPFSSLDPTLRKEGIEWVQEIQKEEGTTVLMITHHLEEVQDHSDYIYVGKSESDWNLYDACDYNRNTFQLGNMP